MAPQPLESRVESLENRVTHVEQQLGPTDPTQPQILPLRTEMRAEFSAVRAEIARLGVKVDEQGTQMRVLHEEVISRIALLQEGRPAQPRRARKK